MIKPLLTPRRITGNATIGLISAARRSVRNIQKSTDTISKAPDVTKEQRFGMNYVGFFGSKKTSKILNKSLKTIRDSIVSTFGIATALKTAVKTGTGIFGFVGKIIGFASNILSFLPFGGLIKQFIGLIALGGLGGLLLKFKDQIFEFFERTEIASKIFEIIKSKAMGFTSYIKKIIADFIIDRGMSSEFQDIRDISEERLDQNVSNLIEKGAKPTDAVIDANKNEIEILREKKQIYIEQNKGVVPNKEFNATKKAYDDRITELETGAVPVQKRFFGTNVKIPSLFDPLGAFAERSTQEAGSFTALDYQSLSSAEKLEKIQSILRDFDTREEIEKAKLIYQRELKQGELNQNQFIQATDILKFLEMVESPLGGLDPKKRGEFLNQLESASPIIPRTDRKRTIRNFDDRRKFRGGENSGGGGTNVSVLPMSNNSPQPDLARIDTGGLTSGPSMRLYSNVDPDNFVALINKSSLNVV